MAHYALLDENNVVTNVITGRNENETVQGISDWENYYGQVHNQTCKRTSWNTYGNVHQSGGTPFRKNYAQVGGIYSEKLDAFIPVKPFPSWTLDEETCQWVAPSPYPEVLREPDKDDIPYPIYTWNESTLSWVLITP